MDKNQILVCFNRFFSTWTRGYGPIEALLPLLVKKITINLLKEQNLLRVNHKNKLQISHHANIVPIHNKCYQKNLQSDGAGGLNHPERTRNNL